MKAELQRDAATFSVGHHLRLLTAVLLDFKSPQVLVRIRADDASAMCCLGTKYGCEPASAAAILAAAAALHTDVVGVSFHVGSGSRDPKVHPFLCNCRVDRP